MTKHDEKVSGYLWRMESVVEDVEDEREKEGSPADDEGGEDSGGCDGMGVSIRVQHSDSLSRFGHDQGHHCYTVNIKHWEYPFH